jgi:hypothetical protein
VKRRIGSWSIFLCVFGGAILITTVSLAQFATPTGKYAGTAGSSCAGLGQQYAWPDANGQVLQCVSNVWTLVNLSGTGATSIFLGSSASSTNPARSGETTTGLYTSASGKVDVSSLGAQVGEFSAAGLNLGTSAATAGALKIGGVNGISYPAVDTNAPFASIAIGSQALASVPVMLGTAGIYGDVAIGYQSMSGASMTTAAVGNTAVGYQALTKVNTGFSNTGTGFQALKALTGGIANTALGNTALASNVTGSNNAAVGAQALLDNINGGNNVGIGNQALLFNNSGNFNAAFGVTALERTTASDNTAIGYQAGDQISTGANNLILGYNVASTTLNTGSNDILIGTGSTVDTPLQGTNNFLNIGNLIYGTNIGTAASPGNVGIGTASPNASAMLDLSANTNAMLLPVGTTGQEPTCNTAMSGGTRYNSSTSTPEFCNGLAWIPFKATGAPPGSGFFVPSLGQFNGCLGPVPFTITNAGTTATATTTGFGVSEHDLVTGQSVTITGATPAAYNGTFTITVTSANTFTYTMLSNPGGNNTTISATFICPDSGGLALANKLCLKDLTTNTGWFGYAQANAAGLLTSAHITAFLCDGTTCQNPDASKTYYFGDSFDSSEGGGSFTTDGSGLGPNDSINWWRADHIGFMEYLFSGSQFYWTGRGTGTATKWASTSAASNTCSGWTSTSGNGEVGSMLVGGTSRWAEGTEACNSNTGPFVYPLLCLVNP